jgi:short-subunit dehydrogenase
MFKTTDTGALKQDKKCQPCWYIILSTMSGSTTVNEPKRADIVAFPCDISKREDVLRMGTQILEKFDHIDLLINNAGFGEFGKVENQSIERIEAVMRTNYFGMV